ncbi:MAG TPA: glycosyltransferase family 4 protein [Candidatus Bathyarchaeia archaeon]|nr:glycosyltransferase family 4 protein [Candidatus Bathyarchaeia archaeon]
MKICLLVPGSGGSFYCQNCLRDYSLVRALRVAGEDAAMVPLYLPPFGDEADTSEHLPVFFGGISVYLRHHVALLRRAPTWLDRLLDAPWLLKLAGAREGSTNAAQLGPMALEMLEGRHGFQKKEFDRLINWLDRHEKPDVIHISNALLIALATELRQAIDAPVVCSLQDEEPWVEAMGLPYSRACWDAIAGHAPHVSRFIATSGWYADRMAGKIGIPREKIDVLYPGVEIDEAGGGPISFDPPTIGFLSRINEAQGFDLLADAFIDLKRDPALENLRLRASGGCTHADKPFFKAVMTRLGAHGVRDSVEIVPRFTKPERRQFLRSLSVLSTPVRGGEAFGAQLLEAMACGVPVVQPRAGAYPEIIEATGGGLLYDAGTPGALAGALRSLLVDPQRARALGGAGRAAVRARYNMAGTADAMIRLYQSVLP